MLTFRRTSRPAFSMLEVVMIVAVISILAAAVVPNVVGYLTELRVKNAATTLNALATSINKFGQRAAPGTTYYPFRMSHLGRIISTTDTSSCSGIGPATPTTLYAGATPATNWNALNGGPYYNRTISTTGYPVGIGIASDTLFRTSAKLVAGLLQIKIPNVSFEDANELNILVDGAGDANQGDRSNTTLLIRWGAPDANELVTVTYNITLIVTGTGC